MQLIFCKLEGTKSVRTGMIRVERNNQGLEQVAKQAHFLESMGSLNSPEKLRTLLEKNNCCPVCGKRLIDHRFSSRCVSCVVKIVN